MPNIKSAVKRVKLTNEREARNTSFKSAMRSAMKDVEVKLANNDVEGAKAAYVEASKKLDKAARKNMIHKNKAARQKARLAKKFENVSA